jgi:hypothetical protein
VNDTDRAWLRSLPLLLMSSFLMIGAAWAFFKGDDSTASIAAFAAGLILLGAWLVSAVIDWYEGHSKRQRAEEGTYDDATGHDAG